MQSSSAPKKLSIPFANSGDKQDIPNASQIGINDGRASYYDGFPPVTRIPLSAGGKPPFGTDMNGVLFDITGNARWSAAGASYKYDADFSSAIGGYPKGAIISNASADGFWQSIVENNTTNPDAGGAGWIDAMGGRLLNVRYFTSSGVYTPTAGTKSVLVEGVGGGGGAGGAAFTSAGSYTGTGGGGAGGYFKTFIRNIPSSISYVVGTGGNGGSGGSSPTSGQDGTITTFGVYAQASGGKGSVVSQPAISTGVSYQFGSGFGGFATNGNILNSNGGDGAASVIAAVGSGLSGAGGASCFSAGGSPTPFNASGTDGKYGSGGGGVVSMSNSSVVCNGGRGGNGLIIVWEYS
ncbi:Uncharacterised protein [Serratia marcescens]|nr:Uncharacterised protein [Serratia marcescens]